MSARFLTSAASPDQLPDTGLPEAAFVGRSNVGKSTLLARVLKQPKLVRTSRTPGRTQLLNMFLFEERLALVDLPGYGYAKLSKNKREELQRLIRSYLSERGPLCGVVQVLDSRRDAATDEDRAICEMILESERGLLVAVTKIDQVPKNRRVAQLRKLEKSLGVPSGVALACSGKTGDGRAELVGRLLELTG